MEKMKLKQVFHIAILMAMCVAAFIYLDPKKKTLPGAAQRTDEDTGKELSQEEVPGADDLPRADVKVVRYDKSRTAPGVILFPVSGTEEVLLLDHDGNTLHRWSGIDAARARLQPDCSLLVVHGSKWGLKFKKWHEKKKFLTLYDREGSELRSYQGEEDIHHDAHLLSDGSFLFLEVRMIPYPKNLAEKDHEEEAVIRSDAVYEVNEKNEKTFSWLAENHLDLENCGWNGCEKRRKVKEDRSHIWDWTHLNTISPLPANRHFQSGDKRFEPGNFFVMPRNFWTAYLVDRKTKKVVWEYSGEGKERNFHKRLVRGHEIHMIPEGYPGSGNVLVFDNGLDRIRNYSRILEIDPVTQKTLWEYQDRNTFYSRGAGSVQRLKNGNTLISEDMRGRVFEVTPEKEIVWEIQTKFRVSRAHKYAENFCK